jgi:hypothetical protein
LKPFTELALEAAIERACAGKAALAR